MIKVYRENNNVDHEKPYRVLIDNIPVFDLLENDIKSISLDPGKHTIKAKSDKYVSNELEFTETDEGIVEFIVEPDYTNNVLSKFFTSTIYGKQGLKVSLKKEFYI